MILDEPWTGLDAEAEHEVHTALRQHLAAAARARGGRPGGRAGTGLADQAGGRGARRPDPLPRHLGYFPADGVLGRVLRWRSRAS
ncbi:hypothetical protein LKL35_01235 [Streptomyces sp. ET3-23]|uniref:hypothetical protein n=1 Tax=Streptomyces sp. ET3-23 TaxID=2885643 RepID=UPI001D126768|nr:hypothetical protein [Streptomyces sp. ET3-23]MCC2274072.1 hypothetical protein [Streptomyces sp. ET3-23]